ncbi:MAG: rRNA maturation RNase YbeY [Litoricolaceae bacterium]|nr:rRNA maturation RNase YbeY [Litorivicinaceae bacterium]
MIIEFDDATGHCPVAPDTVSHWCETLLKAEQQNDIEVAIRIVDANESQTLNRTYRGKDSPTNVLSFPAEMTIPEEPVLLGDIAICWPVVVREAKEQAKSIEHHLAHMVIHGCFHLLGYDHDNDQDAEAMEAKEIGILNNLGYPNPYLSQELKDT